jgi:glycine/D-amino acid oxidase-like deaminating enzyme
VEPMQISRVPKAIGAAVFPAGSLYPLRFVHGLLSICLSRGGFQLFTQTPVHSFNRNGIHWSVQTNRGTISAKKVLVATNGYSRALLPCLDNFLLSHRAHCSSIIPPAHYSGESSLKGTCSITRQNEDYEYLVQRPSKERSDNAFILGGGQRILDRASEVDTYDDSYVDPALPDYFASYPTKHFENWKEGQGQLTHTWTGIQGYTKDIVPIVGESFDEEGVYLAVGHSGHGMARAVTCAEGVARLILTDRKQLTGEEWEKVTGLPLCYRWTKDRSNRTDVDYRGHL